MLDDMNLNIKSYDIFFDVDFKKSVLKCVPFKNIFRFLIPVEGKFNQSAFIFPFKIVYRFIYVIR